MHLNDLGLFIFIAVVAVVVWRSRSRKPVDAKVTVTTSRRSSSGIAKVIERSSAAGALDPEQLTQLLGSIPKGERGSAIASAVQHALEAMPATVKVTVRTSTSLLGEQEAYAESSAEHNAAEVARALQRRLLQQAKAAKKAKAAASSAGPTGKAGRHAGSGYGRDARSMLAPVPVRLALQARKPMKPRKTLAAMPPLPPQSARIALS